MIRTLRGAEVEGSNLVTPGYRAVIALVPAGRSRVLALATPAPLCPAVAN